MRMTVVSLSEVAKANRLDPGYWIALADLREKTAARGCTVEALQASLSKEEAIAILEALPQTPAMKDILAATPWGMHHGGPVPPNELIRTHPYETLSSVMASMDRLEAESAADKAALAKRDDALSAVTRAHPRRP